MKYRLLFLLILLSIAAQAQNWSTFLNPSRAIDWSSAGFTIPDYTVGCATQPTLLAGSSNAAANAASIQKALASCDATHNVVNIPAGTWYITAVSFGTQGYQVLRGAGANSTTLIPTTGVGCTGGQGVGICMMAADNSFDQSTPVLPPSGTQQCLWTGGLSQGSTSLTLSSCGGTPPTGHTIILDQQNDTADNGGVYICDNNVTTCGYETGTGGNNNGRYISGVTHSQQQVAYVNSVTSLGGGSYTVNITPGVYFNNIRSGMNAGAWWPGMLKNAGVENLTIDGNTMSSGSPTDYGNIGMYSCYHCWVKGVRSENAGRYHIELNMTAGSVIRDSYFYGSAGSYSQSYSVEFEVASANLIENNIFQDVTLPTMFGAGTGNVIGYNFSILSDYNCGGGCTSYVQGSYVSHNAGNDMNLFEGNDFLSINSDDAWGTSSTNTFFRNMFYGWQTGKSNATTPIILRVNSRAYNVIGNVLGEPGYHTGYQTYASSTSGATGSSESSSIYTIGLASQDACTGGDITTCDPATYSTLMRWGNYDTVNGTVKWNSTYASPGAVAYVNANFSSSYFGSLSHTLPSSLYYSSKPIWWPSGIAWPPIGPDITSGNVGMCSGGTYPGEQATSSAQCAGGTLATEWGSHVNANPAENCYLNGMNGPPDGTGSVLAFDPGTCYASSTTSSSGTGSTGAPAIPTGLVATAN